MKRGSIAAAAATGLFVLAHALPASAATTDDAHQARQARGQRTSDPASMRDPKPRVPRGAAPRGNVDSSSVATASAEGGIGVGSQGQSLTVDNHARAAASSAIAPPLTGSNDTCMGSTSIGAAGMAFGLSLGTTYTDDNCMMLKNARELWNMGFRGAAVARMCMDERNRQALEASGVPCSTVVAPAVPTPTAAAERERRDGVVRDAISPHAQPERFVR